MKKAAASGANAPVSQQQKETTTARASPQSSTTAVTAEKVTAPPNNDSKVGSVSVVQAAVAISSEPQLAATLTAAAAETTGTPSGVESSCSTNGAMAGGPGRATADVATTSSTDSGESSTAADTTLAKPSVACTDSMIVPVVVATAEITAAGVPFLDVLTAEQVKAMVEEDERAWAQARESERKHQLKTKNLPDRNCGGAGELLSLEREGGWSEVGIGGGSRSRGNNGANGVNGGGRSGRLLSMQNVRAVAARAARSSSPGSDPATTTSASSSECSEASKENLIRAVNARNPPGRRASVGRATHATGKELAVAHAQHSVWSVQRSSTRNTGKGGHGAGVAGARAPRPSNRNRDAGPPPNRIHMRDSDRNRPSRPSRVSYAPWAGSSAGATGARAVRIPRESRNHPRPTLTRQGMSAPSAFRGEGRALWNTPVAISEASKASTRSVHLHPLARTAAPAPATASRPVEMGNVRSVENRPSEMAPASTAVDAPPPAPAAAPVAWTNTAAHPLGVQPEPAAVPRSPVTNSSSPPPPPPPQREMSFPPPQHQHHWDIHTQQQQHQHQHQRLFQHSESHIMPVAATGPVQDGLNQSLPPPPPPPIVPPHQHHLASPSCDMTKAKLLPVTSSSDESFPLPPAHANGGAPPARAIYRRHTVSIPPSSAGVDGNGGGEVEDEYSFHHNGSYESQSPGSSGGGASGGFTVEAGSSHALPHQQLLMLPVTSHDQPQGGRQVACHDRKGIIMCQRASRNTA